jgi:hypothetical protein
MATTVRPATLRIYRQSITAYVLLALGHRRLADLDPLLLTKHYAALLATPMQRRAATLSPRTVRYVHVVLKHALADAVLQAAGDEDLDRRAAAPLPRRYRRLPRVRRVRARRGLRAAPRRGVRAAVERRRPRPGRRPSTRGPSLFCGGTCSASAPSGSPPARRTSTAVCSSGGWMGLRSIPRTGSRCSSSTPSASSCRTSASTTCGTRTPRSPCRPACTRRS